MKKLLSILVLAVFLVATASVANAANKVVPVSEGNKVAINLSADEPLGAVVVALKFAEPGTDVICTKADLSKGIGGYLTDNMETGFSDAKIDNENKTILAYSIPVMAEPIPKEGVYLTLEFKGHGNVKLEETSIGPQTGISLVNTKAEMLTHKFDPIEFVAKPEQAIPKEFSLSQNYPNPFNPTTTISYALPQNAQVKLSVYNILGQKVRTLVDEYQSAGYKQVTWNGQNDQGSEVSSGIYFYKIQADSYTKTAKMSMLK